MQYIIKFFMAATIAIISIVAHAEQSVTRGEYEIHYNVINSTFIQPDIAQKAGIIRSKRQALVNVSVLKLEADKKIAVPAMVTGTATNLMQQSQKFTFKQIKEGTAIYYLGQFGFSNDQAMHIKLRVQPDPNRPAEEILFDQHFYED